MASPNPLSLPLVLLLPLALTLGRCRSRSRPGTALASAIWMPNVEFIFGLTGATASVLLSYILPALTFIRLTDLNPELLGGGKFKTIAESVRWGRVGAGSAGMRGLQGRAAALAGACGMPGVACGNWKGAKMNECLEVKVWRPCAAQDGVGLAQAQGNSAALLWHRQRHHLHGCGELQIEDDNGLLLTYPGHCPSSHAWRPFATLVGCVCALCCCASREPSLPPTPPLTRTRPDPWRREAGGCGGAPGAAAGGA